MKNKYTFRTVTDHGFKMTTVEAPTLHEAEFAIQEVLEAGEALVSVVKVYDGMERYAREADLPLPVGN